MTFLKQFYPNARLGFVLKVVTLSACLLFWVGTGKVGAQNEEHSLSSDTARINYLNKLGWKLKFEDPEHARELSVEALQLAELQNYPEGVAAANNNLGVISDLQGRYNEALARHEQALTIRRKLNDPEAVAASLNNLASVYKRLADYPKSIAHYLEVIQIMKRANNDAGLSVAYNNLGAVFQADKKYDKALENYLLSLDLKTEMNDANLPGAQFNVANMYYELGVFDEALAYFKTSLRAMKAQNNKNGVALNQFMIGQCYLKQEKEKMAQLYLESALYLSGNLGLAEIRVNCLKFLSEIYEKQNEHSRAFLLTEEYLALKDSMQTKADVRRLQELEGRLALQHQESKFAYLESIKNLNQTELVWQGRITEILILLLVLFVTSGLVLYNRYLVIKKTNQALNLKDEAFAEQKEFNDRITRLLAVVEKQKNELEGQSQEMQEVNRQLSVAYRQLEKDNQRKTLELDEARDLQFSILPREVPNHPELDIAVFMKTAQEVGGDYYDFFEAPNGSLQIALGDATGHGLKAAFLVTVAKSYYQFMAGQFTFDELFQRLSQGIAALNLNEMYLAFLLLEYNHYRAKLMAASMPPLFIYRAASDTVEELKMRGMFLGSPIQLPYEEVELHFAKGDVVLLMSDGLPELTNENEDLYGYERVYKHFEELARTHTPQSIIEHLIARATGWLDGHPYDDDITLLVMKIK